MENFGARVKHELKVHGKLQKDLCLYLNVNKSTVSEWLNDKNEPPMRIIVEIAKFLEVSTDYLFGLED
ncbi:MAG: helix-turn-helix domain-containing protein [Roseburia sp.]|nr:helix-turn-helix domain-containing protein [Roseburia sp.]